MKLSMQRVFLGLVLLGTFFSLRTCFPLGDSTSKIVIINNLPGGFHVAENDTNKFLVWGSKKITLNKSDCIYFIHDLSQTNYYVFNDDDILVDMAGQSIHPKAANIGEDYVWIHVAEYLPQMPK